MRVRSTRVPDRQVLDRPARSTRVLDIQVPDKPVFRKRVLGMRVPGKQVLDKRVLGMQVLGTQVPDMQVPVAAQVLDRPVFGVRVRCKSALFRLEAVEYLFVEEENNRLFLRVRPVVGQQPLLLAGDILLVAAECGGDVLQRPVRFRQCWRE